jgi:two-component system LytT family response regulator
VLIVDDEPPARLSLRLLLEGDAECVIVGECGDGLSAVEAVTALRPDLLFLDVQMPGLDGFGVLDAIGPDAVPAVVFVTAFDQYALRAFEAHALDYLLKPFSDERCASVIARAKRRLSERSGSQLEERLKHLLRDHSPRSRQLIVRDGGRVLVIPWTDIDWIGAEDYCIRIYAGPSRPLIRQSLQGILAALDPDTFVRIHRSTIVNLTRVREVRPQDSGDALVLLADGTKLRLSRGFRAAFDAKLRGTEA